MIHNPDTYGADDTLRNVIRDNSQLLTILNRFGISLGFGDRTIAGVCAENGVDTDTFLAVLNYIGGKRWEPYHISLTSLMGFLRLSHKRILEHVLPGIKRTLIEGINEAKASEIAIVILEFYDKYMEEVAEHMDYEEQVIFKYVENLLEGNVTEGFRIADFSSSHSHTASKLDDLKELFIYKYKQPNSEKISDALLDLIQCGTELKQHCEIENLMLFPAVSRLETEVRKQNTARLPVAATPAEPSQSSLTAREAEVLRWIANGLSTKEIADKMFLSVHTVNTHRKNISAKLDIHSVTGLAFYAVLHGIVDINEIALP